ncbi:MAG: ABC transporter substrate-binding protein [Acidimicrobiales bacterium]
MKQTLFKLLAVLFAFALIAAACGDDEEETGDTTTEDGDAAEEGAADEEDAAEEDAAEEDAAEEDAAEGDDAAAGGGDLAGTVVTILGPETGEEAAGFVEAFEPFTAETGIEIQYTGSRDATTEMNLAVEGGSPPDLGVIPQPGRIQQFAADGAIVPIPQSTLDAVAGDYNPFWFELGQVGDEFYGMPNKGDVKSLVWYSPATFEANGYEIPETWDELEALSEQMKTDGIPPWCVGIGSGDATGWPFTDWMEDVMLRLHGPDVYDAWVSNELPFNAPEVAEVVEFVSDIWFEEGNVLGGRDIIAQTGFQEAGLGILDGSCGLHRQANFYAAQFVDAGATIGEDVDVFYLPTISDEFGQVVLGAGTHVVAFADRPEVLAVLEYIGTAQYADARIAADKGGFLSPNTAHDTSAYSAALDTTLADILVSADPFRFDASDLMPGEVGSGEWWSSGTDYVSGSIDLETFLDNVQNAWPT